MLDRVTFTGWDRHTDLTELQTFLEDMPQQRVEIAVLFSTSRSRDWALASEAIWFRDRDAAGQPRLVKHDLRTGQVASFDFAPSGAGSSIAISPDGKRLIVMREAPPAIDLMLARRPAD